MTLDAVLSALGAPDARELLEPGWDESMQSLPSSAPHFLWPANVVEWREYGGFGPELDRLLLETAKRVGADPALHRLAWHVYRLAFVEKDTPSERFRRLPLPHALLGEQAGLFYLLIANAVVPLARRAYRALFVPEEIARHTCLDLYHHALHYRKTYGAWGIRPRILFWLQNHRFAELFRLGRMQYKLQPFRNQAVVYRNAAGETLALACPGQRFNPEGFLQDGASTFRDEECWESDLHDDSDVVAGHPIDPRGFALRRAVRLPKREWRKVLDEGDTVLEMHIPEGGRMTPEASRSSMRWAAEFFDRYFPNDPFKAFGCWSWIFNTQFEALLPADSNMINFMRQLYLLPSRSNGNAGLYFIFGEDRIDPASAPRDTSIRRAMLAQLETGQGLRNGAMFFLREDLPYLGTEHYRAHWPPRILRR